MLGDTSSPPRPSAAWASPADAQRVQALLAWTDARRAAAAARLSALYRDWAARWLPDANADADAPRAVAFDPAPAAADAVGACWQFDAGHRGRPARAGLAAPVAAVEDALFAAGTGDGHGGARGGPLSAAVAAQAWDDWLDTVRAALGGPLAAQAGTGCPADAEAAPPLHAPPGATDWSGALGLRLPFCGGQWSLRIEAGTVRAWSGGTAGGAPSALPRAPLRPLAQALAAQAVPLRACLADVELSLGQLSQLRVGDLVTVPHALDAPLRVAVAVPGAGEGAASLAQGWLGRQGDCVALEMARAPG